MALGLSLGLGLGARSGTSLAAQVAALFGPSDVGFWPDGFTPADGRVWQTNAGWPEASAAGQPVGVALDISRGVERGVERISNGAFATDLSNWAASSGVSITRDTTVFPSGAMRVTVNGASNTYATQTISGLTVGARYEISCRAYTPSSNTASNRATIGTQVNSFTVSGSRPQSVTNTISTLTLHFVASGASQIIYCSVVSESMAAWGASGNYGIFTDVSVREIPGLHATQATAGDRPILRQSAGGVWYLENVSSDTLNITLPAGTYTRAWVTSAGGVTIQTGQSLSGTENVLRATETADCFYINRNLTAGEQATLTAYWQAQYAA